MAVLEAVVTNPELAYLYVRLLQQLRGPSPEANINQAILADLPAASSSRFFPGNNEDLIWYYGGSNARKVLLIDGIKTLNHAVKLVAGYANSLGVPVIVGNNLWMQEQAEKIVGAIGEGELLGREYIDIAGHSAGGAVAYAIAQRLKTFEFHPKMKISSFGSPRMGQALLQSDMSALPVARWMVHNDPIPLMPLRLEDAPQIALLLNVGALLNWSNYRHVQGGISLSPPASSAASVLPPTAAAAPINSIASWVFGVENDPNNPHALAQYGGILQAIVASEQQPANVAVDDAPREHSTTTGRREANQTRDRIERAIMTTASGQTDETILTPEATLFKAFRSGRVWYVAFGNATVITAGPEKRARHIARAGNDFLRSLQKQAVVDPETILSQMGEFFELAQDPSTGFRPTINTTPPA